MMHTVPVSRMCTQEQIETDDFRRWVELMRENPKQRHRKLWEWVYIVQTLDQCGMLAPGRRGLGFAVGAEPLPSLFASRGCQIVASDLDENDAKAKGWVDTNQHSADLQYLNKRGICDEALFRQRTQFRTVDMNHIPEDFTDFDFTWSSCSFEHLGSIRRGQQFFYNMMHCLKPGGIGVHTTEFNLSSNWLTRRRGGTVLFRKRDIEAMVTRLTKQNHLIAVNYGSGSMPLDKHVDTPPYSGDRHLKLRLKRYTATSIALVVRKCSEGVKRVAA